MCITHCVLDRAIVGAPGKATTNQELLKITGGIPVAMLDITLSSVAGFPVFSIPHIHAPGTGLSLVDLGKSRKSVQAKYQKE